MPYAEDLVKVTVHFDLNSGEEEAQFGYHLQLVHSPPSVYEWENEIQELANDVRDKTDSWWSNHRTHCPFTTKISHVKVTHLDTTGHALDIATAATALPTIEKTGSSGGNSLPLEVSRCVTMYGYDPNTFVADKRRRRGRVYLPPESISMMAPSGRFSSSSAATVLQYWDAYMEDVQGMLTGPQELGSGQYMRVVIASQYGLASQVEAYSIGDVPDAQRRRRRSQTEARVSATLSHS